MNRFRTLMALLVFFIAFSPLGMSTEFVYDREPVGGSNAPTCVHCSPSTAVVPAQTPELQSVGQLLANPLLGTFDVCNGTVLGLAFFGGGVYSILDEASSDTKRSWGWAAFWVAHAVIYYSKTTDPVIRLASMLTGVLGAAFGLFRCAMLGGWR